MCIGTAKLQLEPDFDTILLFLGANLRNVCRFQVSIKVAIPGGCKDSHANVVRKIKSLHFKLDISHGMEKEINSIKLN